MEASEQQPTPDTKRPLSRRVLLVVHVLSLCIFFILATLWFYSTPPPITDEAHVEIVSGQSVRSIATTLKEAGVVRSELLLYALITAFYDPTNIYAGTYIFTPDTNVYAVARKLAANEVESNLVRITFPEGIRLTDMATIASNQLPNFDAAEYLTETDGLEGYLWPDTYFVPEQYTAQDIAELQRTTYAEQVAELAQYIASSTLSEVELVILASIIEREANDEESMKMVSGILQNRLEINMPLQADATIEYILDTPLNELPEGQLALELRETESPYNTYKNTGLPPTPIGNPGKQAIEAAIYPTESNFYYYITGTDGEFYYARTLSEHNRNIELYLRP